MKSEAQINTKIRELERIAKIEIYNSMYYKEKVRLLKWVLKQ